MLQSSQSNRFHGLELELTTFSGARARRVVHPCQQRIDEHRHDWVCLDIYVLGSYLELHDGAQVYLSSPSVVLRPACEDHANRVDDGGLEMIGIQFDPSWLRCAGIETRRERTRCWIGGKVAIAAQWLASMWTRPGIPEADMADMTARFLHVARTTAPCVPPAWLDRVLNVLSSETAPTTANLAKRLDLHPAWLARAYRATVGEGLQETLRRKRVERAVYLLRNSDRGAAEIAAETGFCDQSHMNRGFRAVMGRSPLQVRAERQSLSAFSTAGWRRHH
jgi:AraC family transcriptional regulator